MKDIAERISIVEDIHESDSLRDLLQRALTDRSDEIKRYLQSQPQRFFNALVVGTYGGKPEWYELNVQNPEYIEEPLPDNMDGTLGILKLAGTEHIFAIDGQHRVAGIRAAIEEDAGIEDEEVCTIFVKGVISQRRSEDPEGFQRTRRLFATLNRYAKPVSKKDIIALDEDDVVAIVTRQMVEENSLFKGKTSVAQTKSIPAQDKRSFTTIVALYDSLDIFFRGDGMSEKSWKEFKRIRPSEEEVEAYYQKSEELWSSLAQYFPPIQQVGDSEPAENIASLYRNKEGGHVLFRPIGLLMLVKVIRRFLNANWTLEHAIAAISQVPMDLAAQPWVGLLWDATNQRMITSVENQKVGARLLFYAAGGELENEELEKLRRELSGLLHKEIEQVSLERYV
jgi:DNA sulfur modification protein DndB